MTTIERIYNYFEREPELKVLFIFDRMASISTDLREVVWQEDYVYQEFDGRWFTMKYQLATEWVDKKVVLLFPEEMKPVTPETKRDFQLLDVLTANTEFRQDNYEEFIQRYQLPSNLTNFVKLNIRELSSPRVMNIISPYLQADSFREDDGIRGLISSYLGEKKLLDWESIVVKMMILDMSAGTSKHTDFYFRVNKNRTVNDKLDKWLTDTFGVSFLPNKELKMQSVAEVLKYNAITQSLALAGGDPYKTLKVSSLLAIERLNRVYDRGVNDVQNKEKFNEAFRKLSSEIHEDKIIEVYGIEAPYFYFTEELCLPILTRLAKTVLAENPDAALERVREISLRLSATSSLVSVVNLIEIAAKFIRCSRDLGAMSFNTPADYVSFYTESFTMVDRLYRNLVESSRPTRIPDAFEEPARDIKHSIDLEYARITNILNLEWIKSVKKADNNFDATGLTRQDNFYTSIQDPSIKRMVIIVSDALRYEMGQELVEKLAGTKHIATIQPMIAMLPTETKYCKPSLLPHKSLKLDGTSLLVDGNALPTLESKQKHLQEYVSDGICLDYKELMNGGTIMSKRDLFKSRSVVYIFHNTIDDAGHDGNTPEACRRAIDELKELIEKLHASWNIVNVFVTADHGFIYNDITFEDKDKHSITDITIEKKTRYYLTPDGNAVEGVTKFQLGKVSSIKAPEVINVAVPDGTNRFAAPGGYKFTHGGASLQEMIIPLIFSRQKRVEKTEKVGVALMDHNLNLVSSRLKVRLIQSDPVTMTMTERTVECQVFDGDRPVTDKKTVVLNSTDGTNLNNRLYEITLRQIVTDAKSTLTLRVWEKDLPLNPLITETVKNSTIIEQDF